MVDSLTAFFSGFSIIFFGYILQSSTLQLLYYSLNSTKVTTWKNQPNIGLNHLGFYFLPLFSSKSDRGPYHRLFTTINLFTASVFAGIVFYCSQHDKLNPFSYTNVFKYGIFRIIYELLLAVFYEVLLEYYWHRLMHTKLCYTTFHKCHHYYKAPEVWDDMYIHPIEAIGYYCILYSPPFILSMHIYSFICYMIIMGLCGVLDHSGIYIHIPLIYNTKDHDLHHSKYNINYGFPFPIFDILHGTYEGEFLGVSYTCKQKLSQCL